MHRMTFIYLLLFAALIDPSSAKVTEKPYLKAVNDYIASVLKKSEKKADEALIEIPTLRHYTEGSIGPVGEFGVLVSYTTD